MIIQSTHFLRRHIATSIYLILSLFNIKLFYLFRFQIGRLLELCDRRHAAEERRAEGQDGSVGERRRVRRHRHQRSHHDERSRQRKGRAQTLL